MEILFYSKYSKACEEFYNKISKIIDIENLNMICIDNKDIRDKINKSTFRFNKVPCIMKFENNTCEIYEGEQAWEIFNLNPKLEAESKVSKLSLDDEDSEEEDEEEEIPIAKKGKESATDIAARMKKEADDFANQFTKKEISSNQNPENEEKYVRNIGKKESATEKSLRLRKEAEDFSASFNQNKEAPMMEYPTYSTDTTELSMEHGELRGINKHDRITTLSGKLQKESSDYELDFQKKPRRKNK